LRTLGSWIGNNITIEDKWNKIVEIQKKVVKNGFSDLTKAQEGRDRPRKDVMNRRRGKALSEGCHERKKAWTVVSSREKINNNKNLVRATTKSKSEMQTVSNGRVGRGA